MFNAQLSRRENEVMAAIFSLSSGKERFLVSPYEILAVLPARSKFDEELLERVLFALELDGYFDLVFSDRKGEKTYCVHMHESGLAFRREDIRRRRDVAVRLVWAGVCGLLSAAVGLILKVILS